MFLLTNNKRDFFDNDKEYSFHDLFGIIAINIDYCFCDEIFHILSHKKEGVRGKKFFLNEGIKIKIFKNGKINTIKRELNSKRECPRFWKNESWWVN